MQRDNNSEIQNEISVDDLSYSWNEKIEIVAKNIGEDAKSYKLMHIIQAQKAHDIYNKLTIWGIIIGPFSGILNAINQSLQPDSPTIPIIVIILSFISGILVAMVKFGKYDEITNANQSAAARYTGLEANIRRQLSLYRANRVTAKTYLEWVEAKYEEILISAPLLSTSVYITFTKRAKNEGWKIPNKDEYVIAINKEECSTPTVSNRDKTIPTLPSTPEPTPNLVLKRSSTMAKMPEINQYSDRMLQYELNRLMRT